MPEATSYDAIVVGTSQGGRFFPIALAQTGRRVALVERGHVGGACVNVACTPTKTMVASARVAYLARRGPDYGVRTGPVSVDMRAVRQRKQAIVEGGRGGFENRIKAARGLDLLRGEAHFVARKTLEVRLTGGGTRQITAPLIVLDVGARPKRLSLEGAEAVPVLDSTTVMELDALPDHLLIVGGGYVALEFGQMFRRFGSDVTIIQHHPRLLVREDDDVSDEVAAILRDEGITVLTGASAQRVERDDDGRVCLTVHMADGERRVTGSHLLAATGRVPNTQELTPKAAGIHLDEGGYIRVDGRLETSAPGVYAMGDAKGGPAFTHVSRDDVRVLRTNLLDGGCASTDHRVVPYTIFTDPQLARVGLSESEARQQGRSVRVAKLPMSAVSRAIETGETRGFMKAIVDAGTGQILGCTILGAEAGEVMTVVQVAMMGKLPYAALRDAIFTHPTLAEGLNRLFAALDP